MRGSFFAGTNPTEMLERPSVKAQSSQLGSSFSSHLDVEELASERKRKGERENPNNTLVLTLGLTCLH